MEGLRSFQNSHPEPTGCASDRALLSFGKGRHHRAHSGYAGKWVGEEQERGKVRNRPRESTIPGLSAPGL